MAEEMGSNSNRKRSTLLASAHCTIFSSNSACSVHATVEVASFSTTAFGRVCMLTACSQIFIRAAGSKCDN